MPSTNPLILKLLQSGVLIEDDYPELAQLTAQSRTASASTLLVKQGSKARAVPLIVRGFACRYRLLPDGSRQILGLLLPGDFCDIQGTILNCSDHFTATLTECDVAWLDTETIDDLTLARTRIARALWWSTLVDECILRAWLTNMGQQDAAKRLSHFFCELLLRLQVVGCADRDTCDVPFGQEALADILGITTVHVSRTLKELRERGLIELVQRQLRVPNVSALRAYCKFDPTYLHLAGRADHPSQACRV